MKNKAAIEKLRDDENYYGKFGKQYLSNSDIGTLLTNPLALGTPLTPSAAFLVGGYFHTAILEPDKLKKYKVIESSTRNTKAYKEISGGELCLLQHEVDQIELMTDKMLENDVCRGLIRGAKVEYEQPGITELEELQWKGKADIVNHEEGLVIDLKTTGDITKFRSSAWRYNYDSQAYIYSKLFGYEMLFIVIDKNTHQIGIFDCSPEFYQRGADKVQQAAEQYKLFFQNPDFDPNNYFINKTL
jgi:exodeoxyribonuclease VIII